MSGRHLTSDDGSPGTGLYSSSDKQSLLCQAGAPQPIFERGWGGCRGGALVEGRKGAPSGWLMVKSTFQSSKIKVLIGPKTEMAPSLKSTGRERPMRL